MSRGSKENKLKMRGRRRACACVPESARLRGDDESPFPHSSAPFHSLSLARPRFRTPRAARKFYRDILKCEEGRSSNTWIDYSLYGHQIVSRAARG